MSQSARSEFRRKVRTITRGLETLVYKRGLLNHFRYGLFAWMLLSHKVCRWAVPWAGVFGLVSLIVLSSTQPLARWGLVAVILAAGLALVGWVWPQGREVPRPLSVPTYFFAANVAALLAWINALRGELNPVWEPSRRSPVEREVAGPTQ